MIKRLMWVIFVIAIVLFLFGQPARAQSTHADDLQIEALRADLKADKAQIVEQAMKLKPSESNAFWGVYKDYEKEVSTVNDDLVQLVKEYAEKFGSISDEDARTLTMKVFDFEIKKANLKKKYFPIFSKATSSLTAAKFFQVEHRLELLFNLKLSSELPTLLVQPAASTTAPSPPTGN
jgi:hypothetical protein